MKTTKKVESKNIQEVLEVRQLVEQAKLDEHTAKRINRVAKYVLRKAEAGVTDVKAKTHRGPTLSGVGILRDGDFKGIKERLNDHGIEADTYRHYLGVGDWEDRIAITSVGDKRVRPSPQYARELEMRAIDATRRAKERKATKPNQDPIFHAQTEKYVRRLGDREYVTTDEPHGVVNFKRFASDEGYAEALSSKVIQCVDIMVHDPVRDTILLGTRQQEPHTGDWVIGGGMRAGESVADAAHRNMYRELRMNIDDDALTTVGNYKFIWDSRAQLPSINENNEEVRGCHMSSTLVEYPVSEEAVDLSSFNEEYSKVAWIPVATILTAESGIYHPCLVDMVTDMKLATRQMNTVQADPSRT